MLTRNKALLIVIPLLITLLFLLFSLRNKGIKEDDFVEIYIKLSIAQQDFKDEPGRFEAEKEKIFSEFNFSQEKLDRFLKSCQQNPERWVKIWEKINQRLSEIIERNRASQSKENAF